MRPTIPLARWRIAVDLEATRRVQNQPGLPAVGCQCQWCASWSSIWSSVFPGELHKQLERLRVDIAHPADLYAFEEVSGGAYCRVIYHVVGKLLSGPVAWREDPVLGRTLVYHAVEAASNSLGLVVVPSTQTFDSLPQVKDASVGELLQVDFRLYVPLMSNVGPRFGAHA
jgi:hypothetical protein